ncbi:tail protein [Pseudomonas phage vB_PpuP-Luke-3]
MTKVTGSYESLIRGVSEQVAHQRYPGQHWVQDNMISDPVRGLVRRWGSVMKHEQATSALPTAATAQDVQDFRETSLYLGDVEYSFMHRRKQVIAGSTASGIVVVDKTNKRILPVSIGSGDAVAQSILQTGISSITSAGRFVLLASATKPVDYTEVNTWQTDRTGVCFITVGNYSRTYSVTASHVNGQTYTASYTTPSSYYPGTLDTSDISASATDYVKQVNDRVYAYQTAVNQWIGTSAAAIVPSAVVVQLVLALRNAGFPAADVNSIENHMVFGNVLTGLSITDGANNSTVGAVFQEVEAVTDLSVRHRAGKVIRISPKITSGGSGTSYYVKARQISASDNSGWPKVIWEEAAGIKVTPGFVCMLGCIQGGTFYLASSAAILQSISGVSAPEWVPSSSGDYDSQQQLAMFGKTINYMRLFQDRLMVIAGSTVLLSKTGDYFNFFRASALQIANDDPIEMYALGSDDDVITDGALLDRDLLLFGNVWQYVISGREALSPQSPYISIQSSYTDSNHCSPVSAGNLVFYTQPRDHKLTVQQMQTGAYAGTVATFEVTQQLSKYLQGSPTALVATTSPSAVFVRTTGLTNGVYVFSYLDAPGQTERLFDSWSRWTWNEALGPTVGITGKDGALLTVTLRSGIGSNLYVLDEFTLAGTLSDTPYLDSQRPGQAPGGMAVGTPIAASLSAAMNGDAGDFFLIGRPFSDIALLEAEFPTLIGSIVIGANYDSLVTVTNPYMRDNDGKPILDGRLTVGNFNVTTVDSAAMKVEVQDLQTLGMETTEVLNWVARPAGSWVLNKQQVMETATMAAGVYKETRNCKVTFRSRSWLPFGLSTMEWTGQFFTRRT